MNLNSNPTLDQIKALVAACDDDAGHHCMWVGSDGEVHIDLAPDGPLALEEATPSMKLRFETFCEGNGYVGVAAAADDQHVRSLFNALVHQWPSARDRNVVSYCDYF